MPPKPSRNPPGPPRTPQNPCLPTQDPQNPPRTPKSRPGPSKFPQYPSKSHSGPPKFPQIPPGPPNSPLGPPNPLFALPSPPQPRIFAPQGCSWPAGGWRFLGPPPPPCAAPCWTSAAPPPPAGPCSGFWGVPRPPRPPTPSGTPRTPSMSSTPWGCWGNFGVPPGSPPGASSAPQCRCCHPRGCPRGPRGATPGWGCAGGSWPWGRPRGRGRRCCSRGEETRPSSMWLQHRHGATRRLLAFDSAAAHRTEAVPGVLLFLGGHGSPPSASQSSQPSRGTREVSLQLPPLSVSDDGAFVCSVSALHGQVQQVLQLHVIAPPRVSLLPSRLSPGVLAELRCDAVGFFPLDVEIRWERRTHGHTWPYLGDTSGDTPGTTLGPSWSSGHRRAADGTFSRSAGLRVAAVAPGDSYSCLVTHVAWNVPHRVTVVVAGATGPSVEDMAGMALVAFVIGGLSLSLWPLAGK
uniref:Ig-like domain-containing protein n=1 Tax=Taeniopygia guttata TaxID=59729 RepID=A0A674GY71_TAEGU